MNNGRIIAQRGEIYIRARQTKRSAPRARAHSRTETMKTTLLRAALFALSIGSISPAMAGTDVPNAITQVPAQLNQVINPAQQSQLAPNEARPGHGAWVFPPIGNYLN